MKKIIDFNILLYLAFAMALSTYIPSIGMDSTMANLSSNIMLFLEAMVGMAYLFTLFMSVWFLVSKHAIVKKKQGVENKIIEMKDNENLSLMHFLFLIFATLNPTYPNQKQLVVLLVVNALFRIILNITLKRLMKKANKILNKDSTV